MEVFYSMLVIRGHNMHRPPQQEAEESTPLLGASNSRRVACHEGAAALTDLRTEGFVSFRDLGLVISDEERSSDDDDRTGGEQRRRQQRRFDEPSSRMPLIAVVDSHTIIVANEPHNDDLQVNVKLKEWIRKRGKVLLPLESSNTQLAYILAAVGGLAMNVGIRAVKQMHNKNAWHLLLVHSAVHAGSMAIFMLICRSHPLGGNNADGVVNYGSREFPVWGQTATRLSMIAHFCLGGLLQVSIYLAVRRLPLGDAIALFSVTPLLTQKLSTWLIGEQGGMYRTLSSISTLAGSILLIRPQTLFVPLPPTQADASVNNSTGIGIPVFNGGDGVVGPWDVTGAVAASLVPVTAAMLAVIGRMTRQVHCSVPAFWQGLGALLVALVGSFALDLPIGGQPWGSCMSGIGDISQWDATGWVLTVLVASIMTAGSVLFRQALHWADGPAKLLIISYCLSILLPYYILYSVIVEGNGHALDVAGILLLVLPILALTYEEPLMQRYHCLAI